MVAKKVFAQSGDRTHMPFFDGETLLFCSAGKPVQQTVASRGSIWDTLRRRPELHAALSPLPRGRSIQYRPWKLAYASWGDRHAKRIHTGLPPQAIECSPAFYRRPGLVHVSFIGGLPTPSGIVYHLYEMSGPSLERLGSAAKAHLHPAQLGFVSPKFVCFGAGKRLKLVERSTNRRYLVSVPLAAVYRATFRADQPDSLLVTGASAEGLELTLLHRIDLGQTMEVRAAGPVYKSSIVGRKIVYASGSKEDRDLWHDDYQLVPSLLQMQCASA